MGDEILAEVIDLLYAGGGDELIAKMNPAQSDLAATKRKQRERTQARVGLASNVVGIAAGTAGLHEAAQGLKATRYKKRTGKEMPEKKPKTQFGRKFKRIKGKYAVPLAAGAVGLQAANLAGDAIANRVLARSAKQDPNVKGGAPTAVRVARKQTGAGVDLAREKTKQTFGKDLGDIHNTASERQGGLTKAPKLKRGKSIEYRTKGGYKKLPNKVTTTNEVDKALKTRSRTESVAGHAAAGAGLSALPVALSRHAGTKKGAAIMGGAALGGAGYGALKPLTHPKKKKVKKSADEIDVVWEGDFAKADADKQQVFGWASVVEVNGEPVVDLQGDYISTEEMEKAGYEYVMKSRKGGDMHLRDDWKPVQKSEMIESFIVTPEKRDAMGLPDSVPSGWWVGFQVRDPDVWSKVRSGERTGFSIHGHGRRSPASS